MHEILARENEKEGIAEMLKEWLANKNRDLRERKGDVGCVTERKTASPRVLNCLQDTIRKRLHMK